VRFFGGWNYPEDLCGKPDFAARGYSGGAPMGSDLPDRKGDDASPRFAVWALQDPGAPGKTGTPLQRVQIVKGWLEKEGPRERVYDVAGGPNDASVDLASCERRGAGARQLCSVWEDPDFDADERAFYYARVLENPTCRWSQELCVDAGVRCEAPSTVGPGYEGCCSEQHVPVVQERAWTSPIWYSP
jgi:hypothetical protein